MPYLADEGVTRFAQGENTPVAVRASAAVVCATPFQWPSVGNSKRFPSDLEPGKEMLIHVHNLEPCGSRRGHEVGAHLDEVAAQDDGLLLG